ncbi:hypothetical protein ACIBF1_13365 [Spirillospora sp. NPDC050679]
MEIINVGRVVDLSSLLSLPDRAPALAAPSALHPDARPLGERVGSWARAQGLVLGDPDASPLGRARCDRLAARVFPAAGLDRVELVSRWLTWAFALDDTLDETPLGGSATAVLGLYDDLLSAVRRGRARPGAQPLETTLVELWRATVPGMSRDWRRRFLQHMEEHRAGCAEEAVGRRIGDVPTLPGYPAQRRRSAAPFLFDLIEPVLGVELPCRLMTAPPWKRLLEGTADLVAWSNDVASHVRESEHGGAHNHVAVLGATYGFEPAQAAGWVVDRIAHRAADLAATARTLEADLERFHFTGAEYAVIDRVAQVLLLVPRAHLDWLAESGRYRTGAERPWEAPPPRPRPRKRKPLGKFSQTPEEPPLAPEPDVASAPATKAEPEQEPEADPKADTKAEPKAEPAEERAPQPDRKPRGLLDVLESLD